MSLENRIIHAVLDKHEGFLRRHLLLSPDVVEKLRQRFVITNSTKDRINKVSSDVQVTLVVDILRRRGIRTLAKFLHILKDSLEGWIAEKILCTDLRVLSKYVLTDERTLSDYIIRVCGPPTPEPIKKPLPQAVEKPVIIEEIRTKRPETPPKPHRYKKGNELFQPPPRPTDIAEVPGQVQNLHRVFEERRLQIGSTLSILKQEEQAIKDILEKNVDEQRHLNKNQQAIYDISRRLQSIHHEAGQLLKSAPSGVMVRNRLDYLQGVPWNSVRVNEHGRERRTKEMGD